MRSLRKSILLTALLLSAGLWAQGQPKLQIDIQEQKINMTAEERQGGDVTYTPGDTIEYVLTARNVGNGIMKDPQVIDPVPEGTQYVIDSAKGENCRIVFSVNKGMQYSVWPVMISATTPGGAKVEREARMEEVTHIKWLMKESLPPGGQKKLSFRVVVK
jgi:uncharacterized repeat protein (TIGR01451 family)